MHLFSSASQKTPVCQFTTGGILSSFADSSVISSTIPINLVQIH